jgi:hypothetical protein
MHVFSPAYPVIRTYHVERRNDLGLVVEESDVRHLHYLYEYENGYFNAWWDSCGMPHTSFLRYDYGLPQSVTVTDFESINHTSVFEYTRGQKLSGIYNPNGGNEEFRYDGQGRVNEIWKNGLLRYSYDYHKWDGTLSASWQDRIRQNYIHSLVWDGTHASPLSSYAYCEPNGTGIQVVTGINKAPPGSPAAWEKSFSPQNETDGWGRTLRPA